MSASVMVTDHWPHVLAALPYAGIIAVIAVHFLMHRGHNHAGHNDAGHNTAKHNHRDT